MQYGVHLPLVRLDGGDWRPGELASLTDVASDLGFDLIGANDHLVYGRPWLDGLIALATVVDRSASMRLATTVTLPVLRGPVPLAKAAAALDILSGGRLVLGVGSGSSERDYDAVGIKFSERWTRLDEAVEALRQHLTPGATASSSRFYPQVNVLEPRPVQPSGPPIWIGSWGSHSGLRRAARLGDGWIASAWNLTPVAAQAAVAALSNELGHHGRTLQGFPCVLATMFTYITNDNRVREDHLRALSSMLNRPAEELAGRLLIGPAEECAALLQAYARAGIDTVFVWPLADANAQLERFMSEVASAI